MPITEGRLCTTEGVERIGTKILQRGGRAGQVNQEEEAMHGTGVVLSGVEAALRDSRPEGGVGYTAESTGGF